MEAETRIVTMKGNPLDLVGNEVKVGEKAPGFTVVANDLSEVRLPDYDGRIRVICSVPSLDTPVCDIEARKFNEMVGELDEDIVILTISMDLPFAQKRWCGAADVKNVVTLSDHRDANFGKAYGVLIEKLRLLARAIFVIDKDGVVRYTELVSEIVDEPNYGEVMAAVRKLFIGKLLSAAAKQIKPVTDKTLLIQMKKTFQQLAVNQIPRCPENNNSISPCRIINADISLHLNMRLNILHTFFFCPLITY